MQSYRQYCPVAKAHEILGDRWTLLIVRELVAGMESFNDIARGLPGIPRSTLTARLRKLEAAGIVERNSKEARIGRYRLTSAGLDLRSVITAMGKWGAAWAFELPKDEELDPGLLLWRMRNRLNRDRLPRERVTIAFDFQAVPKGHGTGRFWFVINDGEASVCVTDPGFEIGLFLKADLSAFFQVWLGRMTWRRAMTEGCIRIEGTPAYERAFPDWFLRSPMLPFVSSKMAVDDKV